jgi:ATPase subunit of ABC transporter with duplicated ATPase domains
LEQAIAACPAALLLVSHDLHFRQRLTHTRWDISEELNLVIQWGGL